MPCCCLYHCTATWQVRLRARRHCTANCSAFGWSLTLHVCSSALVALSPILAARTLLPRWLDLACVQRRYLPFPSLLRSVYSVKLITLPPPLDSRNGVRRLFPAHARRSRHVRCCSSATGGRCHQSQRICSSALTKQRIQRIRLSAASTPAPHAVAAEQP